MPQMGVSVSEGTIVEWRKQPGDWVEYEEPLVDISTDKIDTEVPSPAAGRLSEIVVDVGTTVDVGTVLARIATDAKPGEAHASEHAGNGHGAAPGRQGAADERGRGRDGHDAGSRDRDAVPRAGRRDAGRRAPPALQPGRVADGRRAWPRPVQDRGYGPRRPRAQAGRPRPPRGRGGRPGRRRRRGGAG